MTTEIAMVLDRSGSMESIAEDTIGGVNAFLAAQRALPDPCTVTLVQFDHEYDVVYHAVPVGRVAPLTSQTYVPRGSTALLDAIGRTIDALGTRLANMQRGDRPARVMVVIVTDGQENASHVVTRQQVFDKITHQRDVYKWEFVFLGANQDAIAVAATYAIPHTNTMTYAASSAGTKAVYDVMADKVSSFRSTGNFTAFTHAERTQAMADDAVPVTTTVTTES